jgi:hypothetical protein
MWFARLMWVSEQKWRISVSLEHMYKAHMPNVISMYGILKWRL